MVQKWRGAAGLRRKQGCDLSLFDVDTIRAYKYTCRALTQCAKLYEFSIVPAPCNTASVATDVKGETALMRKQPTSVPQSSLLPLTLEKSRRV